MIFLEHDIYYSSWTLFRVCCCCSHADAARWTRTFLRSY